MYVTKMVTAEETLTVREAIQNIKESIRKLDADRTKYKSIVDEARHILRETCGSCGHKGAQCLSSKGVVEGAQVQEWWAEPEKHRCADWRFRPDILTKLRAAVNS